MNKNILLVEPIKHTYIPLAFTKISAIHKKAGDNIKFIIGNQYFNILSYNPEIIYITTLFLWEKNKCLDTIKHYSKLFPKSIIF